MPLLSFDGPEALSAFRRAALLDRCRLAIPSLRSLTAHYIYIADLDGVPDAGTTPRLGKILGLGMDSADPGETDGASLLVAPRPGTISPWSSKATDILHNCGLTSVVRVERAIRYTFEGCRDDVLPRLHPLVHDRMTEAVIDDPAPLFEHISPRPLQTVTLMADGRPALAEANRNWGLALSDEELDYLADTYSRLGRDPSDVELVMFANVNSEHCRHKIFNASWIVDGVEQDRSLFDMIRNTHACHPEHTIKAYSDNAGVIEGFAAAVFRPAADAGFTYGSAEGQTHIVCKVETHNHPTAISPYPGASTGVGGEIRDEGATGTGSRSQAGLCAFYVSHLRIPGWEQPWESHIAEAPARLAPPLQIMTEGPLGGAGFGNEFGRPNVLGVFRTFEQVVDGRHRGYHKPIMVAGGCGLIDADQVTKKEPATGDTVIQIGGPAMLIGLGGGYASSMDSGSNTQDLDFASVQRDNPEMERRCQELIDRCYGLGAANPIKSIHDVGAGGLSNACPELVEDAGAVFDLRAIHNDEPGMSPMEIWSCEAQERYVLVVGAEALPRFRDLAARERCLFAEIGTVTGDGRLTLTDSHFEDLPIDQLPLEVILGKPPRMLRDVTRRQTSGGAGVADIDLAEAARRVLRFPAVADKTFLITIADRTVGGCIARDQMVGPWQVPVADCAVTITGFGAHTGSVMAMGERTPVAVVDGPASGRLAVAEAITNLAATDIGPIERIKLSANWMCACGEEGEDAALFDTVRDLGLDFCPALGVSIPVGKDSLSMRTVWQDSNGRDQAVVAPLSLVISAFAGVTDVRRTATPDLKPGEDTRLLLVDLGQGRNRLGGSTLAQVFETIGDDVPDVAAADVRGLFAAVQSLIASDLLLAYHDRSDGGLLVTAAEMGFAGRRGVHLDLPADTDATAVLYNEEIGALLQVRDSDMAKVRTVFDENGIGNCLLDVGGPTDDDRLVVTQAGVERFSEELGVLESAWSELTFRMQERRDDPASARQEYEAITDRADPGLSFHVPFDFGRTSPSGSERPRVAILREQGINGQVEMAAAFDAAGCESVDVTMTDLLAHRVDLADFAGLAACGGFSYGDVLGAGAGWANTILFHDDLRAMFATFFEREDTFSLGVCNGCQMMSLLGDVIPGADHWPKFLRNQSEQFEARLSTVEIMESDSVLLRGMAGARIPVPVAHGEGRAEFGKDGDLAKLQQSGRIAARYVDNRGGVATEYPDNPNGSPEGLTALTASDGRVTIMMPHPERVFRNVQLSWRPADWDGREFSPWLRMFENAREFAQANA
ncbi:MAG: phosphoribosylformylglycinamidine synthase [Candidatus Latescibacteria bacterium]|nr:phosphoribosylformylglycinamidine synthase [Gemmatimonadaceae bacterium]MDP6015618.1 phosphoribosylformylglycinamidine synthase [Candidatus Latescibacterota bacterium]